MKIETKIMAAGLSAATFVAVSACDPETTFRVGRSEWVQVTEPIIQQYDGQTLNMGDKCVIKRGARLIVKNGRVFNGDKDALGTECPDGAELVLSPAQAEAQNESYQSFVSRRDEVTSQIGKMLEVIKGNDEWVVLVNPKPIEQEFSNGGKKIGYGERCIADGKVHKIGQLTTGEAVMRVINPTQLGTDCPTGAIYLAQK